MWKIVVGFLVFGALAIFVLSKGGDIDLSGEKHGDATHAETPASAASTTAPAPAASAASSVAK